MSDYVPEKSCCDCMFYEFGYSEDPCGPCSRHTSFEPALKEGDLIELAGAVHRVAKAEDSYWLHRNSPAHNLQLFFGAGMSMDQVHDFFLAVDDSIVSDGSWPRMTMLQLVRCIHAVRNDARFCIEPVTVEDTRMPREHKTFKNAEELAGDILQEGDAVVFTVRGDTVVYSVRSNYLAHCIGGCNERVFDMLDMSRAEKDQFAEEAYGYSLPMSNGFWPYSERGDYDALTRLCIALYEKIDPAPAVLKSAADVLKHGLKHGTKVLFPGTTTEYTVEGRPEVFSDGLYLNAALGYSNDFIFDELKLDKYEFCTLMYGYKHKDGDWPETDGEDYPALTRAVVCLMHLSEARSQTRETDKVKSLRAKLAELVAQRESYEEDVQAAKQALNEAVDAVSQASADLSYEEGELESLKEGIEELEVALDEALDEALAGK